LTLLLALLTIASALILRRAVVHALAHRLDAAHEIARAIVGAAERVLLIGLAEPPLRLTDLVAQSFEVRLDVLFHRPRVFARLALQRVLLVANLPERPLVGYSAGRFVEFRRRILGVAARAVR